MSKQRRTSSTGTGISLGLLSKFSFWIVVIIGTAMCVVGILHVVGITAFDQAANYIKHVCMMLAMFIPIILSYRVARSKSTLWFVLWIIFVVLLVVGIVTSII